MINHLFFLLLAISSLSTAGCSRTDGFSMKLIQGPLLPKVTAPASEETLKALSQSFHYLAKGRQSFVFESSDGRYVLKFFNQKYFQMPWYSFFSEKKERAKREMRRFFYENSYEIAFRELGEGILFLHLGASDFLPTVSITDMAGHTFQANLNILPFVLQKKGIPFYEGLDAIYKKEGALGLRREIDAFIFAISNRISKKIADRDSDVEHNWGYIDGKIFHLDPGRLYYDERLSEEPRLRSEWNSATRKFYKWLQVHYPDEANYLQNRLPASF